MIDLTSPPPPLIRKAGRALLLAILLTGCSGSNDPAKVVRNFMDVVVRREEITPYCADVVGIASARTLTFYEVRGYEILNVSGHTVSVRVTYASKAGTDLVKTHRIDVKDGKVGFVWGS